MLIFNKLRTQQALGGCEISKESSGSSALEVAGQPQLYFSREGGRWLRRVRREFPLFGLQWAQARLQEETGRRESWQRKFVVADVAKSMDRAHESGGNV